MLHPRSALPSQMQVINRQEAGDIAKNVFAGRETDRADRLVDDAPAAVVAGGNRFIQQQISDDVVFRHGRLGKQLQ